MKQPYHPGRFKLPKLTTAQLDRIERNPTHQDIIDDTIEVSNVITHILIGALIEPGRDVEQWTRRQIRERLAAREMKRYRTYEILVNAQHKESAFAWLHYYWNKFELTKAPDGHQLHDGKLVWVDYSAPVAANV